MTDKPKPQSAPPPPPRQPDPELIGYIEKGDPPSNEVSRRSHVDKRA